MRNTVYIIATLLLLASCKKPLTRESLYGRWNYIKVENPNSHPPDSVKHADLVAASPYIQFTKDSLLIWWGGKELSHGTFTTAGDSNCDERNITRQYYPQVCFPRFRANG